MKRRKNPTKAELSAVAEHAKMLARWDKIPKFARQQHNADEPLIQVIVAPGSVQRREDNKQYKSKVGLGVATKTDQTKTYTGNAMLGVATLHKSNAVPVFSQQDAIDISKMRR